MKTLDYSKVEYYKTNKFKFDIGIYFNQSIELFTNNWQPFVIYSLVAALLFIVSYFTVIGMILIAYPLMIGYLIGAERAESGQSLELKDFFGGFKNIGNYFIYSIIVTVISLVVLSPYFIFTLMPLLFNDPNHLNEGLLLGTTLFGMFYMLFAIVLLFVLQACMFLVPYLIHYGNMSAIDAMKTSYAIVKNNFWWFVLFAIVVSLVSSLGMVACYIGAIASYPLGYMMVYFMLKDMLLTDEGNTEIDRLGTNQE